MKSVKSAPAARSPGAAAASERSGGVQSLTRALNILDALAAHEDGLSLTALARAVALPPSSAHRLLTTLQRKRFVRFEPAGMMWRIGVQAFIVGSAFARSREVSPLALPYMRQLMERTGETVNLFVHNAGEAVCVAQVQCQHTVRAISRPGGGLPLQRSAAGKAMLAQMGKPELDQILSRRDGEAMTPAARKSARKLHAELEAIRQRGFSLDDEEVAPGLRCIATPILDEHGAPQAAISIAGPTARITNERMAPLAGMVVAAGLAITREFGGMAPPRKS